MGQLIALEHFGLDQRFKSVDLAVRLPLHQFHLAKRTFSNDLDSLEVGWCFLGTEESKEIRLLLRRKLSLLALLLLWNGGVANQLVELRRTIRGCALACFPKRSKRCVCVYVCG